MGFLRTSSFDELVACDGCRTKAVEPCYINGKVFPVHSICYRLVRVVQMWHLFVEAGLRSAFAGLCE